MATNTTRPGRTLAILGVVCLLLLGLVALGREWSPRLGLDLQGGTRIVLEATAAEGEDVTTEKLDQAQEIIAARVNGTGVAAAEVSTRGESQIVVEIPGEERGDIVEEVGRTAQLRFRLVWAGPQPGQAAPQNPPGQGGGQPGGGQQDGAQQDGGQQDGAQQDSGQQDSGQQQGGGAGNNRALSAWMLPGADTAPGDQQDQPGQQDRPGEQDGQQPSDEPTDQPPGDPTDDPTEQPAAGGGAPVTEMSVQEMVATTVNGSPPSEYTASFAQLQQEFARYSCPEGDAVAATDDQPGQPLVTCDSDGLKYLLSPAVIEGTSLTDASAGLPQQSPDWVVNLELDGEGTDVFSDVTQALVNTGRLFAIVLDGQVLSAPEVTNPITNGRAQISGGFTQASSTDLANSLQYGALPLSFEDQGVTLQGPTLAGSQLSAGVLAGIIGVILVVVYCMLYYRGLGIVVVASLAVAALLTYELVILLGTSVGFTLTLPGVAGVIVAVGITADSFIIYFERLRDEVREGKSLRLSVEAGWKRARATILAADAVSLLAAVVLYTFAIDEIRGFAFALGLTTVIDIVVVMVFTKPLVTLLARTRFFGEGHKLSGLDAGQLGIEGRKVSELAHTARRRPQGAAR